MKFLQWLLKWIWIKRLYYSNGAWNDSNSRFLFRNKRINSNRFWFWTLRKPHELLFFLRLLWLIDFLLRHFDWFHLVSYIICVILTYTSIVSMLHCNLWRCTQHARVLVSAYFMRCVQIMANFGLKWVYFFLMKTIMECNVSQTDVRFKLKEIIFN